MHVHISLLVVSSFAPSISIIHEQIIIFRVASDMFVKGGGGGGGVPRYFYNQGSIYNLIQTN